MSRKTRAKKHYEEETTQFQINHIKPKTKTQDVVFQEYNKGKSLFLHGYAGTGKTFVTLYLAIKEVLEKKNYKKILILRSAVPSRNQGFLPGSPEEKAKVFEEPYEQICDTLFGRGDGYKILKLRGVIEFSTTSYLRGITLDDTIIVVDEVQNLSWSELNTVMTRIGENSKIIFCGDFRQTDLRSDKDLRKFMHILSLMSSVSFIDFKKEDIIRSGLCKEFIIKTAEYEDGKCSP